MEAVLLEQRRELVVQIGDLLPELELSWEGWQAVQRERWWWEESNPFEIR